MASPDIEREIDDALRRLPPPRAPRSLTPRVMAAVRARREAPWYSRPMTTWPVGLQVLVTGVAVVPLALAGLWLFGGDAFAQMAARLGLPSPDGLGQVMPPSVRHLAEQSSAVVVLWRVVFGPALAYAAAFALACGCVFAVCAAALTRVVLGRVPA